MNFDEDIDLDGDSNLTEYTTGLDPTDPSSFFQVKEMTVLDGESDIEIEIRWLTQEGRRYRLYALGHLKDPWSSESIYEVVGDGTMHSQRVSIGGIEQQFFRIEVSVIIP
jgi:hypothetical protein